MGSLQHFPLPKPPMTQHEPPDLAVASGIVADMRTQGEFLIRWLQRNQHIDHDVWMKLTDVARELFELTDLLLCVRCLQRQRITIGRGQGFDPVLCDAHERELMERQSS